MTKPTKWLCAQRRLISAWASARVFVVRMKKAWVLRYLLSGQRILWSDWADAQADLSLRWAHSHFLGFVMSRLIYLHWWLYSSQLKWRERLLSQQYGLGLLKFVRLPGVLNSWVCIHLAKEGLNTKPVSNDLYVEYAPKDIWQLRKETWLYWDSNCSLQLWDRPFDSLEARVEAAFLPRVELFILSSDRKLQ